MRGVHDNLLGLAWVGKVYRPVGMRILIGADGPGKHVRQCFAFSFFLIHVSERPALWVERFAHEFNTDFCIAIAAGLPYRFFNRPIGGEDGVREIAARQRKPNLVCN